MNLRLFGLTVILSFSLILSSVPAFAKEGDPLECPTVYTSSEAPVGCPGPREDLPSKASTYDESYTSEERPLETYRGLHYIFGIGGSGFVRKKGIDIKGMVGALSGLEFRFAKLIGVGFDSYYGYLMGSGNQYLSAFNPGIKLYPLMYRNPNFEPFIFAGGHAFDAIFGSTEYTKVGYAQGGFAGAGAKIKFGSESMWGAECFVRASFLYMKSPNNVPGFQAGRSLVIPIYGFVGMFY